MMLYIILAGALLASVSSSYLPEQVMVDVTNDFGTCILKLVASRSENVAFSPYGLVSVALVLYEGANGPTAAEVHNSLRLPWDTQVTRVGFRDLHRYLKSYFTNNGFLRGLVLSKPNVILNRNYTDQLQFYGFDLRSEGPTTIAPPDMGSPTTQAPNQGTTLVPGSTTTPATTRPQTTTTTKPEGTTTVMTTTMKAEGKDMEAETTTPQTTTQTTPVSDNEPAGVPQGEGTTVDVSVIKTTVSMTVTAAVNPTTTAAPQTTTVPVVVETAPTTTTTVTAETAPPVTTVTVPPTTTVTVPPTTNATTKAAPPATTTIATAAVRPVVTTGITEAAPPVTTTATTEAAPPVTTEAAPPITTILTTEAVRPVTTAVATEAAPPITTILTTEAAPPVTTTVTTEAAPPVTTTVATEAAPPVTTEAAPPVTTTVAPETVPPTTTTAAPVEATVASTTTIAAETAPVTTAGTTTTQVAGTTAQAAAETTQIPAAPAADNVASESQLVTRKGRALYSKGYVPHQREGIPNWVPHYQDPRWSSQAPQENWFFTPQGGERVPIITYTAYLPFAYISEIGALALQLPLDDPRYYMMILLPEDRDGLEKLLYAIQWCSLRGILNQLKTTAIYATIPSFTIVKHINLVPPLTQMGILRVFDPNQADLSAMATEPGLYVKTVEQVVTVSLRKYFANHRWFDATPGDVEQHFIANHPFVYFVFDRETQVALMAGTIVNPIAHSQ